jgi:hypothetical protein
MQVHTVHNRRCIILKSLRLATSMCVTACHFYVCVSCGFGALSWTLHVEASLSPRHSLQGSGPGLIIQLHAVHTALHPTAIGDSCTMRVPPCRDSIILSTTHNLA